MLHDFLLANRALSIDRCQVMVASGSSPKLARLELAHGVPIFLEQVAQTLAIAQRFPAADIELVASNPSASESGVGPIAMLHGRDLFDQGLFG